MKNTLWDNIRLNLILILAIWAVMALFLVGHMLISISEKITSNGQINHNITTEYVVINPWESWDVKEKK